MYPPTYLSHKTGSRASRQDVTTIMNAVTPDVVVLELCQTRYDSMLREAAMEKKEDFRDTLSDRADRLAGGVKNFYAKYGLVQTVMMTVLSTTTEVGKYIRMSVCVRLCGWLLGVGGWIDFMR